MSGLVHLPHPGLGWQAPAGAGHDPGRGHRDAPGPVAVVALLQAQADDQSLWGNVEVTGFKRD